MKYGNSLWEKDRRGLRVFKKKVLRRIFVPKYR
jgi:hypothetical protein